VLTEIEALGQDLLALASSPTTTNHRNRRGTVTVTAANFGTLLMFGLAAPNACSMTAGSCRALSGV
jgi:hypothetical protein